MLDLYGARPNDFLYFPSIAIHARNIRQLPPGTRADLTLLPRSMFGGRGPQRENIFVPDKGFKLEHLDKMGPPPLLTSDELDYYVAEYGRNGLGPACMCHSTQDTSSI